jgi:N4-(beta-N-acetylglucosaminyl)-L-asparaginase
MEQLSRRAFLAVPPVAAATAALGAQFPGLQPGEAKAAAPGDDHRGPACIASLNGLRAAERAFSMMKDGYDPADCIVQGVRIVEDDPNDTSVGYGGLPNEDGIVELDASVMYGPTHKCGAVASIRNIKNPAMVALEVLRRTNHCLLVGEGALKFALQMGFKEENLLTEQSRREWQKWRENMSKDDARLDDDQRDAPIGKVWIDPERVAAAELTRGPVQHHTGTVHCSILTPQKDLASCTSTSGLSWKIPGRVGDSPIIGAGNYCDNDVGAAGSTGRGESNIANLSAFLIVHLMSKGATPAQACLEAAQRVVDNSRERRLLAPDGRVNFDLKFYALRKDGAYGAATLFPGGKLAVCDETGPHTIDALHVYDKPA